MNLFEQIRPVNPELLFHKNDPNDVRLGEVVKTDHVHYEGCAVVIIGCPQDEGVRRNGGRVGAAQAPDAIRNALYRLVVPADLSFDIFDMGNTVIQPTLEETHDLQSRIIQQLIADGKQVVSLGGGNDVAYPDCMGLAKAVGSVLAINVDAHFDVRADRVRNSGTPYRQLLEEGHIQAENFYEVGSMPMVNSGAYREYLRGKNAHIYDLETVQERGIETVFREVLNGGVVGIDGVFWGLDMDVVRVSDAPGVSAINPLGLTAYEFCKLGAIAGQDSRTRIFEITEVNPTYDIDSRTAKLAAVTIHEFLSHLKL